MPCDRFEAEEFALPATVPGNIEDALFSAGRIGDPYYSLNAKALRPYEFFEWIYEREFEYDGAERELELLLSETGCWGELFEIYEKSMRPFFATAEGILLSLLHQLYRP